MVFGKRPSSPFAWLQSGIRHGRAVGKVSSSRAIGSGFLINGEVLDERWTNLPLFLTVRHVVGSKDAIRPEEASISFEGMFTDVSRSVTCNFESMLATSPHQELGYTLLLLSRWPGLVPDANLALQAPGAGDRVYVMGYPGGRELAVSLEDNEVVSTPPGARVAIGREEDVVCYRAPTEGGSSGSIVFNEHWEPVALHMAASRESATNYGVFLQSVISDARSKLTSVEPAPELVERLRQSMHADDGVTYQSVFISYSHADSVFANRLYTALQMKGIRAWLDKYEMIPGRKIMDQVAAAIDKSNAVLLCCSRNSLTSWWVDGEIERAFEKERMLARESGEITPVLIPLDVDGYLHEWKAGSASQIRSRYAEDFKDWQNEQRFEAALDKVARALKVARL